MSLVCFAILCILLHALKNIILRKGPEASDCQRGSWYKKKDKNPCPEETLRAIRKETCARMFRAALLVRAKTGTQKEQHGSIN